MLLYFALEILYFENFDLHTVVTPVKVDAFEELLIQANYNKQKREYLVNGFQEGFSLEYRGEENVRQYSANLRLRIGSEIDLWNKVMKEVKLKRFAGPFDEVPFEHFIQSPIGLVPKDGGNDTRLTFHLSYPRNEHKQSVNKNIPEELCKVKYSDFDSAVQACLEAGIGCHLSKSDMKSAFRNLGISRKFWKFLILKARNPISKKISYFIDKCLPFGAAISCAIFQSFSDAVAFLVKWRVGRKPVNYLDDFLFVALMKWLCNHHMQVFMEICKQINFPISLDKTMWASTSMIFLGLLIDSVKQMVFLPKEKVMRGRELVQSMLDKPSKKTTVKELQQLCGFLNFLCRAVVPGRAFTRRLYAYTGSDSKLKPHHHIKINSEMRADLLMWNDFLHHHSVLARPFADFSTEVTAETLFMYSDASLNPRLGMGAICQASWTFAQWNADFIKNH